MADKPDASTPGGRAGPAAADPQSPDTGRSRGGAAKDLGIRSSVIAGVSVIALFFGGLGAWASLAPLDSAAIAQGSVVVEGNLKTIQHLEGGIIRDILVRDGDTVAVGQLLVRLDVTQPQARLAIMRGRQASALALEARLIAERDGLEHVDYPTELLESATADYLKFIEAQENIFTSRRDAMAGEVSILQQRIGQSREVINGLRGQVRSQEKQLELIGAELEGLRELYEKGFAPRTRILALQREAARIDGERNQNIADIARTQQSIGEERIRIGEIRASRANEAVEQLREVQAELFDLEEQIMAGRDVLARTEVRAPIAGTILRSNLHTPGGVVRPGDPLMEIVPSGDELQVEARVSPSDIDVIGPGQTAQIRFTAFNQRNALPIYGEVVTISADSLIDDATREAYFQVRIRLTDEAKAQMADMALTPGMRADVLIVTGTQTVMDYLLRPLQASLNRTFREQ